MEFTTKDLDNLSSLARIEIKEEEKDKMLKDFKSILGYISEINSVSGETIKEKEVTRNVMREDVIINDTARNEVFLKEAPATENGFVKVAKVFN